MEEVDTVERLEGPEGTEAVYDPGETVTLVAHYPSGAAAPSEVISAAATAVSAWNSEVFDLAGHEEDLPRFNSTVVGGSSSSGTFARLEYRDDECGSDTNCGYCGSWGGVVDGVRVIHIEKLDPTDSCGGRITEDLSGVITHELSHVLGFQHTSGAGTEWCVTNVPEQGDLNALPCRYEQQSIYKAYDLRNTQPSTGDPIANRIVIIPNPDTVFTGSSDTVRAFGLVDPEPSAGGGPTDTITLQVDWDDGNSPFFSATGLSGGKAKVDGVQIGEGALAAEADDQKNAVFPWPVDTATIVVQSASGLDPCFDEEHTQTWRSTDQYLTTGCGSTGANIQYRWRFQAGGSWTSFSADTIYDFQGHSTADTHTVTMEVKNTSTGATEQSSRQFTVLDS